MKTHLELDGALLEEVIRFGGFATKKAAVNAALKEYSRTLKRQQLLKLPGKILWEGDLRAMRADRPGTKP